MILPPKDMQSAYHKGSVTKRSNFQISMALPSRCAVGSQALCANVRGAMRTQHSVRNFEYNGPLVECTVIDRTIRSDDSDLSRGCFGRS